jgi:ribosomal protein S18 acetylase RimI-like enzyme
MNFHIEPLDDKRRQQATQLLIEAWGTPVVVSRGKLYHADQLPGFVAVAESDTLLGLLTYHVEGDACEVVTLNSTVERTGVGTALLHAATDAARAMGCHRVWLITTNDNTPALHFYQKRGFFLAALYPGSLAESRRLKPQISLTGIDGIPLRDEIELAIQL